MKRGLAFLLSVLLLMTAVPLVSADTIYNDDQLDWGGMYDPTQPCKHRTRTQYEAVASTCTEAGHGAYALCNDCGTLLEGSNAALPLLDHTYHHACDADCNVCGAIREVGEHNYSREVVVNATCGRDGQMKYTCSVCGDSYTEVIPALVHAYSAVVTAPTCYEQGYTTHTCTHCGDSYVDSYVAATNHKDATITVFGREATCTQAGLTDGTYCSACGTVLVAQEVIAPKGHVYDDDYDADCNTCGSIRDVMIRGDADGDGRVNNRDFGYLQQYLNERPVNINVQAVDMDGNGRLNNRDLGLLQRYLNAM